MNAAPMIIKPFLKLLSRSEMFLLCVTGLSLSFVSIIGVYESMLSSIIPDVVIHVISAALISSVGAITIGRIIIPHDEKSSFKLYELEHTKENECYTK